MATGKRIVIATHGTLGDLHPYLAIAVELARRGQQPIIATSEFHRRRVEATGIEFRAIRPDISFGDKELHRRLTEPRRGLEREIREYMLPVLRATYEDLRAVVQEKGPADLLVSHVLVFAAPLVADKWRIPWVSTELQPGAFMSTYDPPVLAPLPVLARLRALGPVFHRALFGVATFAARSWSEPARALRRELALPPGEDPLFEGRHSPDLVLALFSTVFGAPQPDWPRNVVTTGFPFYDEPHSGLSPELEQFLAEGEPPVVFTLGSSAVHGAGSFYAESAAAAASVGVRAVLLVGQDQQARCHLPSPPASSLSLTRLLQWSFGARLRWFITAASAHRRRPCVPASPCSWSHSAAISTNNAARLQRLGVGRTILRRRYSAVHVARELTHVLNDPAYGRTAAELGRRVRAEAGVGAACDAIEERLRLNEHRRCG